MPTASAPMPKPRDSPTSSCESTRCAAWCAPSKATSPPRSSSRPMSPNAPKRATTHTRRQRPPSSWAGCDGGRETSPAPATLLEPATEATRGLTFPVLSGLASRWLLLTLVDAGDWQAVEHLAGALLVRGDEAGDIAHRGDGPSLDGRDGARARRPRSCRQVRRDRARSRDRRTSAPRRACHDGPEPGCERGASRRSTPWPRAGCSRPPHSSPKTRG